LLTHKIFADIAYMLSYHKGFLRTLQVFAKNSSMRYDVILEH